MATAGLLVAAGTVIVGLTDDLAPKPGIVTLVFFACVSVKLVVRSASIASRFGDVARPGIYLDAVPVVTTLPASTGSILTRR
jgi:hypothetical protein